jgi:putative endonuclease
VGGVAGAWVYILRCNDGSYYTGLTRHHGPEARLSEHAMALSPDSYTAKRLPVTLAYAEYFDMVVDAIAAERRMKGWSRAKKEAVIRGDWEALPALSKRRGGKS